ncbi:substrate-binding periplasmic protein [Chitinilyticum piscinae]|uniref:Transporter substrate-binding domain-containing protein n=1 Tax=Chitinilyticum piscinae TaxID=2866724 RepID=A0A8J7FG63_9NEIS|nr:transporter substrate-binding domain-containing protein [Chitinilyticum piscinae]MBE9608793.1 transporter substrate-binding domain-containing protein [Chitinilyticum piscinae]
MYRLLLVLFALLPALQAPLANAACSRTFTMATENWPPYVYRDAQGKPAGLDIELVQAVFREAGCTLIIGREVPRKRRLVMHQNGELSLLLAASQTAEREQYSWFTEPYRDEITGLASLESSAGQIPEVRSLADLLEQHITLISPNSGWYGEEYEHLLPALRAGGLVSHYEDIGQGMKMLAAGRGRLLLGDLGAINWTAQLQGVRVRPLGFTPVRDKVHFMLSRKAATEQDIRLLNAAIQRLERSGKLREIRLRYGVL